MRLIPNEKKFYKPRQPTKKKKKKAHTNVNNTNKNVISPPTIVKKIKFRQFASANARNSVTKVD